MNSGNILLIARKTIQRFSQDNIELAALGILHERLNAGAHHACPGQAMVGIDLDDSPAFALRSLSAKANLILNRGLALHIG
ncbi:hypothetical protein AZF00_03160 [Zhongshania aliphaticivorans]|uniref:Uncharacterized protein n=1 Tax=Zhongshania aliphaticivorans TaxID=1470434 RepID=A0A127M2A9_9GAMM|nr:MULTISPECIES: hypothetical protein [Spongiibacteraceae]AMO67361.1 hypothetical protein AZF00_03160 [Zhongshania aliphaticivorans]